MEDERIVTKDGLEFEEWFCFKILQSDGPGEPERLVTPWGDPMIYEHAFDFYFESQIEGIDFLKEYVEDEGIDIEEAETFILVREMIVPVMRMNRSILVLPEIE